MVHVVPGTIEWEEPVPSGSALVAVGGEGQKETSRALKGHQRQIGQVQEQGKRHSLEFQRHGWRSSTSPLREQQGKGSENVWEEWGRRRYEENDGGQRNKGVGRKRRKVEGGVNIGRYQRSTKYRENMRKRNLMRMKI